MVKVAFTIHGLDSVEMLAARFESAFAERTAVPSPTVKEITL